VVDLAVVAQEETAQPEPLELQTQAAAVVVVVTILRTLFMREAQAAPALSSSKSINKEIHAKQSLSILWN
jgi:hypothetical protein